jgi:hypothetical protein
MKRITPSNLRSLFPRQIPKDIVNLVDEYMFNDIREAVKNLIYSRVSSAIKSELMTEKLFIERVTERFVKKVGNCFKEFIEKYQSVIMDDGSDVLHDDLLHDVHEIIWFVLYPESDYAYSFGGLIPIANVFNQKVLTKMGGDEGYFSGGDTRALFEYLNTLRA